MKSKIHYYVYAFLSVMVISVALMCIFWLPGAVDYIAFFLLPNSSPAPIYVLCAVIGIIFIAVLLTAYFFPKAIAEDTVFSNRTSKLLLIISICLFADCLLLGLASVWLLCEGEYLLSPALLFVSMIGLTVALMLFVLSGYVARATILKEEADSTL